MVEVIVCVALALASAVVVTSLGAMVVAWGKWDDIFASPNMKMEDHPNVSPSINCLNLI